MGLSKVSYSDAPGSHLFEPSSDNAWGKTPLRFIQHITEQVTKNYQSQEVALELINADKNVTDRLSALLEAGGIDTASMKMDTYNNHTYVRLPKLTQDDLIRVAAALSNTVETKHGGAYYPLLPRDALNEIVDIAAENMQISPLITLKTIEMDDDRAFLYGVDHAPSHYTDIDLSGYPGTPVSTIVSDSEYSEIKGKPAFAPVCYLNVTPEKIPALSSAFKKAGLDTEAFASVIKVGGDSRQVVQALEQGGLIPSHFTKSFD
jgi:hypothetical protein